MKEIIDKKEEDFQEFMSAIKEYHELNNMNRLYKRVLPLVCDDFRVHYLKSAYYRRNRNSRLAVQELDECLKSLKNVRTDARYLGHDNSSFLLIDHTLKDIVNEQKIFFYAGETYAIFGKTEESLEAYKQYQIESRIASHYEPVLYSFRAFNEYSLSDLINKEITLVHPREFNDPFDSLVFHWIEGLDRRCKEKKHVPTYKKSFDYYRVRSFVKDGKTNKAYQNILMWSHYANEHKGYCIKYRFEQDFTKEESCTMYFRPINYVKKDKKINVDIPSINSDLSYCTKYSSWRYENEVRLIAYMPDEESHFSNIPMGTRCSIEAVYFGKRCDLHSINTIKSILKGQQVRYYKMESQTKDIFNLKAVPI